MITEYHRPKTLDEALRLLQQADAAPLGGGTLLSHSKANTLQAVDLQLLGLDTLRNKGNDLELGGALTLQTFLESDHCPSAVKQALKLEAPLNLRNAATVAGTLVACDGRSTFATVLLALDAKLTIQSAEQPTSTVNIGDFLPLRNIRGSLITAITIPATVKLAFEYVARTPSDKPIVCVAVAGWGSGRRRMAVGGFGKNPTLAMDGTESDDLTVAAQNACHEAQDDYGSAAYRMDVAGTLIRRCAETLAQ